MKTTKSKCLPWDEVEKTIRKEQNWLKETLIPAPFEKPQKDFCNNCILRNIATLIVDGSVEAKEFKSKTSLWKEKGNLKIIKPHGKDWHIETMSLVANHFKSLGFRIAIEPNTNHGRADLGVYKKGEKHLFVEIGSVSFYKLLINFQSMRGSMFLIVLDKNHAVEFTVKEAKLSRLFKE